jgi:hypothetical protein
LSRSVMAEDEPSDTDDGSDILRLVVAGVYTIAAAAGAPAGAHDHR